MTHNNQCEQFDNIHALGGITVTFNQEVSPHHMLESIIGTCGSYYSVFEQFEEEEFQEQKVFFDEWYQVYSSDNDSEPYFNVLISGNTMRIEPF